MSRRFSTSPRYTPSASFVLVARSWLRSSRRETPREQGTLRTLVSRAAGVNRMASESSPMWAGMRSERNTARVCFVLHNRLVNAG